MNIIRNFKKQAGMTIGEVLVVLFVLGTLVLFAGPKIAKMYEANQAKDIQETVGFISAAATEFIHVSNSTSGLSCEALVERGMMGNGMKNCDNGRGGVYEVTVTAGNKIISSSGLNASLCRMVVERFRGGAVCTNNNLTVTETM